MGGPRVGVPVAREDGIDQALLDQFYREYWQEMRAEVELWIAAGRPDITEWQDERDALHQQEEISRPQYWWMLGVYDDPISEYVLARLFPQGVGGRGNIVWVYGNRVDISCGTWRFNPATEQWQPLPGLDWVHVPGRGWFQVPDIITAVNVSVGYNIPLGCFWFYPCRCKAVFRPTSLGRQCGTWT